MRLHVLIEDLHHALDILKSDAAQLAAGDRDNVGVIELVPDWEEELPKLIHRYEKEIRSAYNSFEDPDDKDEREWIKAHYNVTMEFLVKHGLAKRADDENI